MRGGARRGRRRHCAAAAALLAALGGGRAGGVKRPAMYGWAQRQLIRLDLPAADWTNWTAVGPPHSSDIMTTELSALDAANEIYYVVALNVSAPPPSPGAFNCSAPTLERGSCGTVGKVDRRGCERGGCCWDDHSNWCYSDHPEEHGAPGVTQLIGFALGSGEVVSAVDLPLLATMLVGKGGTLAFDPQSGELVAMGRDPKNHSDVVIVAIHPAKGRIREVARLATTSDIQRGVGDSAAIARGSFFTEVAVTEPYGTDPQVINVVGVDIATGKVTKT
eukprot:gene3313-2832_t